MTTTTADKGELLPICQCGSQNVKRSKIVHDRFTCNDCHEWVRESQTSAVDSEPLCKDKAIGTAYETETEILIASPHGYDLTEEHNCDAMGCGQWHVLHRFPKNRRPTCEQQRTTNEGQDGLTDEEILFEADNYALIYGGNRPELIGFARAAIERALNQRLAVKEGEARVGVNGGVEGEKLKVVITTDMAGRCVAVTRQNPEGQIKEVIWELSTHPVSDDQQAKDAALLRGLLRDCQTSVCGAGNSDLCGRIAEALHSTRYMKDAALSTTKQEGKAHGEQG